MTTTQGNPADASEPRGRTNRREPRGGGTDLCTRPSVAVLDAAAAAAAFGRGVAGGEVRAVHTRPQEEREEDAHHVDGDAQRHDQLPVEVVGLGVDDAWPAEADEPVGARDAALAALGEAFLERDFDEVAGDARAVEAIPDLDRGPLVGAPAATGQRCVCVYIYIYISYIVYATSRRAKSQEDCPTPIVRAFPISPTASTHSVAPRILRARILARVAKPSSEIGGTTKAAGGCGEGTATRPAGGVAVRKSIISCMRQRSRVCNAGETLMRMG
eukprot:CAMPEP_0113703070 /NCGR_PEP_ID=MMETSP0038_2-20120614/25609_1 /TAXON_ID=2898 /ORGANISM="Cryptomonas paramecium" /LENGTH=271 /DNA_ID=CAMNT_0000627399 /DNA_START=461 /DNA_END=1277 /DNA_ORIENTATION=+ /assembly_acc=CAM_ASM_000170